MSKLADQPSLNAKYMALNFMCKSGFDHDAWWGLLPGRKRGEEELELLKFAEKFDKIVLENLVLIGVWWFGFGGDGFGKIVGLFLRYTQLIQKRMYLLLKYILL